MLDMMQMHIRRVATAVYRCCAGCEKYFEGCSAAQDPQGPFGSCDGNIEAPDVRHKANASLLPGLAGTHTGHDNYIHLLALEAVYSLNDDLQSSAGQSHLLWAG